MTGTIHLLTGEYPPGSGGVGDYTRLVAIALSARGLDVHVWCPRLGGRDAGTVTLHELPDAFGPASRRALSTALASCPGTVLLQYVPNALGLRGANLSFCLWLLRLRRAGADVRVMFHEPYFYFSWHPLRNVLAGIHRIMAALLLRASAVAYVSTASWIRCLGPWNRSTPLVVSPIPSTVPADAACDAIQRWRQSFMGTDDDTEVVGHFGTFGAHVAQALEPAIRTLVGARPTARVVCVGRGSADFAARLSTDYPGRVIATGPLDADETAAALRACDVLVQPYPDGVTTRRTSVMAALANGLPVVSTNGALTEAVWRETGAVSLAAAGDSRGIAAAVIALLCDVSARAALAAAGRRTYEERFAIERTIDVLLEAPVASV